MCEHCDLLRSARHRSGSSSTTPNPPLVSPRLCGAYSNPDDTSSHDLACSSCVVYALLHYNTFRIRWNSIQVARPPTTPTQVHRSIHSPTSGQGLSSSQQHRRTTMPPTPTPSPCHTSRPTTNFTLPPHITQEMDTFIQAAPNAHNSNTVHLPHPTMSFLLSHVRAIRQ